QGPRERLRKNKASRASTGHRSSQRFPAGGDWGIVYTHSIQLRERLPRQARPGRRVEPLDVRRVDLLARPGLLQLLLDLLSPAPAPPPDHFPQPPARALLDYLP